MQEDNNTRNEKIAAAPARHRRRRRGGRALVVGAVALVGLGLAGASAVALDSDDRPAPTAVALDAQARAEADARADRSDRMPITPASPSATASPTTASPSASPTPKPTRKATPKPTPKRTATPKPKPSWVLPMKGADITSCYGPRWGTLHAGIDFAMPAGTPVRAAFGGTVEKAGDIGDGYGISVVVNHGNGYLTHYAHLSTAKVGVGDKVGAGETIGLEGSTGDSTGPHLHFEVHQGQMWNQIDPGPFLRARGVAVGC
ncbi:M23 family metallopeptidase [Micromonospora halophytica]|uniref:Murein DD-endopeptidase MepM and murein hydrolase activator NlpD, contain LysM domain n=1 Tax=Micromonospora halophytica TaxID=47864 RepID=A0A1C5GKF9_9ACTN|nr:M23 family metallopeptidase [Micromonospora halophytica]SCG34232.1 Murein DD-endopeptidase MepM and murein hydrolase activator NlpD, contain LysM domain [Micromonospora halophytica]